MAHYLSDRLVIGALAERPSGANPLGGAKQLGAPFYLAVDTGEFYFATGQGWTLLGTLSGSGGAPAAHETTHLPAGTDAIDWTGKIHAKGTHAGRPAAAAGNAGCLYSETDTGSTFRSDGTTWLLIAVNAGGVIDGLTSDGSHGIIVQDALTAGNASALLIPDVSEIHGQLLVVGTVANVVDGDQVLEVIQTMQLADDYTTTLVQLERNGATNGHIVNHPVLLVADDSDGPGPLQQWRSQNSTVGQVDAAGLLTITGIGLYGVPAPATQPTVTITTSTITDAVALAAIHALILLINGCGLAAITEA